MNVKPEIREKILSAVQRLQAEGITSPTNDQVRERMGGGSLSHISPVMREWRESQKSAVTAALEIPADLKRVIESALGQVWTAAGKLASQEIERVSQEAREAVDTVTGERDEALTEISRLEAVISGMKTELHDQAEQLRKQGERLDNLAAENNALAADNASQKVLVAERNEQIKMLRAELHDARADGKELQNKLIEIANKSA